MSRPRLPDVVVTIRRAGGRDADREALLAAVASATGVEPVRVRAGCVCPHCGATARGRPWAEVDGSAVGVSRGRTTGGTTTLDGVAQPVAVAFPAVDLVLAVAGGAPLSVGA
ncbi:hypothetical protein Q7F20_16715 [Curtobacterium sp. A7_M15]|uniref:hypothetical protein n=1 Tax=Curtobacterium sp. A7_M15 TaxID=3065241 RepID=UPI002737EEEF|nr:hypothetical protein [Curtobacterium sp. A7_M15]MDP4335018.1 hypothetical protein [Curtobacterium sp. A7_M15]